MQNKYAWDHELAGTIGMPDYVDYPGAPQEPNFDLLALEPPKRFLDEGSVIWVGMNTRYKFRKRGNPNLGHGKHVHISVDKYNYNYPYVRLLKIHYYFMRDKNCMHEKRKFFKSLVYNLDTKAIYKVDGAPQFSESGRTTKTIKTVKRIGLNRLHIPEMSSWHKNSLDRFITKIKDKMLDDMPNVCDECSSFKSRLIALNIQHRCGKAIPGLNDTFIGNIQMLVAHDRVRSLVDTKWREAYNNAYSDKSVSAEKRDTEVERIQNETDKEIKKILNKTLYRFMPTLKSTGSMKKALKTLLTDEYYLPFIPKLISEIPFEDVAMHARFVQFLKDYEESVPKPLKHEIAKLTKTGAYAHITELFSHVINMINDDHINKRIKDAWIRTMVRLGEPISWHTWKDLYNMAGLLGGIRIRPNNFQTVDDVQRRHDAYSVITRARTPSRFGIAMGLMTFTKVDYNDGVFVKDRLENKFMFVQLLTPDDLRDESDKHGHCVHSYADGCFEGRSVIFRLCINSEPVFTVEYDGEVFEYVQAEGSGQDGTRHFPSEDILNEIIIPFGRDLLKREKNNQLSYRIRAELRADLIKLWTEIPKLENIDDEHEVIVEQLEVLNCDLEKRTELDKMITDPNKSSKEVVDKLAKIKRHTANQFVNRAAPRPRQIAPDVAQPVAVLAPADDDEEFPF